MPLPLLRKAWYLLYGYPPAFSQIRSEKARGSHGTGRPLALSRRDVKLLCPGWRGSTDGDNFIQ